MPINDLLTQLDVTPPLAPAPADDTGKKRAKFDPSEGSEYRDRLARSMNSPTKSTPEAAESPKTATARANRPAPKQAPSQTDAASPGAPRRTASPDGTAATGTAQGPPAAEAKPATNGASTTSELTPAPDPALESELPTEDQIVAAAMALLTITAAAPVAPTINLEAPTTPIGVFELLDSTSSETTGIPVANVSVTDSEPLLPPGGLIESFNMQGTVSTTETQSVEVTDPLPKANPQSKSQRNTEVVAEWPAQAEFLDTQPGEETPETKPLQPISIAQKAEARTNPEQHNAVEGEGQTFISAKSVAATAFANTATVKSSGSTLPSDQWEREGGREDDARARSIVASASLPEGSADDEHSGDAEPGRTVRNAASKPSTGSGIAVPSISDIFTTELIVDEAQPASVSPDTGTDDSQKDSAVNSLNAPHHSARSSSPISGIQPGAVGKITQLQAQQLVDRVSNALQQSAQSGQSLKVRLSPPELGVLQIEVTQRGGVLSARLEAQTASAHQVLIDNLSSLREALAQTGTVVDRIEVQVAPNRGSDGSSDQTERHPQNQDQQTPQREYRRDGGEQTKDDKHQPHNRKGVRSLDQLDIQI